MRVCVLGAGAVGCMMGGLIKRHVPEVELLLIARGEHGERMRQTGEVELRGYWGTHHVPVRVGFLLSQRPEASSACDDAVGSAGA